MPRLLIAPPLLVLAATLLTQLFVTTGLWVLPYDFDDTTLTAFMISWFVSPLFAALWTPVVPIFHFAHGGGPRWVNTGFGAMCLGNYVQKGMKLDLSGEWRMNT
jgi:hypothetical protein